MSGLNVTQVKTFIIRPTLALLPERWNSEAAVNLLAGTFLVESGGEYIAQLGGGPALGVCQMEPVTHNDCYATFLNYPEQAELRKAVMGLLAPNPASPLDQLPGNLFYAFAMARVRYIRAPEALPSAADAVGLAGYWKAVYNTAGGAGAVDASHIALFQQAIAA